MEKIERKSNIELLRIISMIMIVVHHFCIHSGFDYSGLSLETLWFYLLSIGGKIGVDIFMLISGYFLVSSNKVKTKKLIKFIGQAIFYASMITITLYIVDKDYYDISLSNCFGSLFPISTNRWWFVTSYFIIYIFHPYINKLITTIGKKKHLILIIVMTIIWSLFPTFIGGTFHMSETAFLLYLYLISAYIALYLDQIKIKKSILKGIGVFLLTYIIYIVLIIIEYKRPSKIIDMNSPLVILCSLYLFIGFKNLKIKNSNIINKIASTTFGIYLLHDYNDSKIALWRDVLKGSTYQGSIILIPYSLYAVLFVFVMGFVIELIRTSTIEKLWIRIMVPIVNRIEEKSHKIINRIELYLEKLNVKYH